MSFVLWSESIAAVFCVALGGFTLIRNPKGAANRSFALFASFLALWIPSELIKFIPDHQTALAVYRFIYIGGSLVTFAFVMFMWDISGYKRTWVFHATKWTAVSFAVLSQTSLMIKDIRVTTDMNNAVEEIHGPIYAIFMIFFFASLFYSLKPLILGYAQSSSSKRKQLQYIMGAFFLTVIAVIDFFANQMNDKIPPLYYVLIMGMNTMFAIAILKHRLMDITVIIRKTLVYSLVTSVLAIMYLATIWIFAHLFQGVAGDRTVLSSAIAAGLIAFCFQPLLRRVQTFVDAKFFRQYVDREEKLYELSREVITHTTPEVMAQALTRVLQETLHPKVGALYLKSKDGGKYLPAAAWGDMAAEEMAEDNQLTTYFATHPQPFVQDMSDPIAESLDTREVVHKGRPAA